MKAKLVLEDGTRFEGRSFGAATPAGGEVVFNTSMTGYQEILTDPSYHGQIVTMTYPLIGNYGVCPEDNESEHVWAKGLVIRELCRVYSNWRGRRSLEQFLHDHGIPGIEGVDTRALTRHIRLAGAMKGVMSTDEVSTDELKAGAAALPGLQGRDLVRDVSCSEEYPWTRPAAGPVRVVVIDCGVKRSILRQLAEQGCQVTVVPATMPAETILDHSPRGVVLSNGPGDPAAVSYLIDTARELLGRVPLFGICLGHQILGLAVGGRTYKLKFGHHGGNHPVKDLRTGRIAITAQNHGFCLDAESLDPDAVEVTHLNLYDSTVEGIRHRRWPVYAVQFHPEAGPGPHDARGLFGQFVHDIFDGDSSRVTYASA